MRYTLSRQEGGEEDEEEMVVVVVAEEVEEGRGDDEGSCGGGGAGIRRKDPEGEVGRMGRARRLPTSRYSECPWMTG